MDSDMSFTVNTTALLTSTSVTVQTSVLHSTTCHHLHHLGVSLRNSERSSCCNGHSSSQWENWIFGVSPPNKQWCDKDKISHNWLHREMDPTCKNLVAVRLQWNVRFWRSANYDFKSNLHHDMIWFKSWLNHVWWFDFKDQMQRIFICWSNLLHVCH